MAEQRDITSRSSSMGRYIYQYKLYKIIYIMYALLFIMVFYYGNETTSHSKDPSDDIKVIIA